MRVLLEHCQHACIYTKLRQCKQADNMVFSQTLSPVQGEIGSEMRGKEEVLHQARDRGKGRSTEQDKRENTKFWSKIGGHSEGHPWDVGTPLKGTPGISRTPMGCGDTSQGHPSLSPTAVLEWNSTPEMRTPC